MANIIADVIILAIFVVFCIVGLSKGFVKMIMRIFGKIGAFLLACAFSNRLSAVFEERYFNGFFKNALMGYVERIAEASEEKLAEVIEGLPEFVKTIATLLGYSPDTLAETVRNSESTEAAVQSLSLTISHVVSSVVAFAVLFFGIIIVAWLLSKILDAVFKLPVLKAFNKTLGFVAGAVEGIIVIWLAVFIFVQVLPYLQARDILAEFDMTKSWLLNFVATHDPLTDFFMRIFRR